jgi:hypothetical protein
MSPMHLTLDRIESGIAVLIGREDESVRLEFPLCLLPEGSREGDVLEFSLTRSETETRSAKDRISALLERLKGRQ